MREDKSVRERRRGLDRLADFGEDLAAEPTNAMSPRDPTVMTSGVGGTACRVSPRALPGNSTVLMAVLSWHSPNPNSSRHATPRSVPMRIGSESIRSWC